MDDEETERPPNPRWPTIEAAWREFDDTVISRSETDIVRHAARQAFYSGAAGLLGAISHHLEREPDPSLVAFTRMQRAREEIVRFVTAIEEGKA